MQRLFEAGKLANLSQEIKRLKIYILGVYTTEQAEKGKTRKDMDGWD